jgi:cell division septum initiation protein DivIVA
VAQSGRERHRDREPSRRQLDDDSVASPNRAFRLTDAERQQIAKCLRYIDDARRALESQQNPDNREIIRELRASADRIFDLLSDLEELDS